MRLHHRVGSHRWTRTNKRLFQRQVANQFALVGSGLGQIYQIHLKNQYIMIFLLVRLAGNAPACSCFQSRWVTFTLQPDGESRRNRTGLERVAAACMANLPETHLLARRDSNPHWAGNNR